ncbi:TetR/AcrR family transcriptional regulator [Nocardia blacklockiae]|uniref:TetR/AcrR family transcriptional regulator n=1 Tax=Nocardia blacklockiae TaxID=480036 RepID=UPI0018939288|nr:TetR/AcrR family transcriptional regulator [Nocardia blacklockiae]MBF6175726.1 TetR/AcrR family transcriptional regulator C-terminal domain-containing protein [Nocardia blacklockiae]
MSDEQAPAVPADLARLWRLPAPHRPGRPPELDVDTVVTAAVQLADEHGLAAVTLEKVARALGFTKMALYRHVGSKEQLLELMTDQALGPPPEVRRPPARWRAALTDCAVALRERYARRGWLLQVPLSGPPRGPHQIGWVDVQLRALRGADLDELTKLGLLMPLDGYVRQACLQDQQMRAGRGERGQAEIEAEYGATLAALVDAERFPYAAKLFAAEPFSDPGEPSRDIAEEDFRFGLDVVLDGIAAVLARGRR